MYNYMVKHKRENGGEIQVPQLIAAVNETETVQNHHPRTEPTRVQPARRACSRSNQNNNLNKRRNTRAIAVVRNAHNNINLTLPIPVARPHRQRRPDKGPVNLNRNQYGMFPAIRCEELIACRDINCTTQHRCLALDPESPYYDFDENIRICGKAFCLLYASERNCPELLMRCADHQP